MHTVGLIGQIMVFFAGLAVLLDLIALAKLQEKVRERLLSVNARLDRLKMVRPLRESVDRMKIHAATETAYDDAKYFTPEEFAAFVERKRKQYWDEYPGPKRGPFGPEGRLFLADQTQIAHYFEEPSYDLLMSRLPKEDATALEQVVSEFERHSNRILGLVSILLLLALPFGILLAVLDKDPRVKFWLDILLGFLSIGLVSGAVILFVTSKRNMFGVMSVVETVRLRLARAALRLIGPKADARPLRWTALGLFVIGSLLNLIAY